MTNGAIEEPPEKIVTVNKVEIEVKEVKVEGFSWKYLKKFFSEQMVLNLKSDWSAVMDLMNNECKNVNPKLDNSSNGLIGRAKNSVKTYEGGKYKDKEENISTLLNKLSGSVWILTESNSLPGHTDVCPEIEKAYNNMDKILKSLEKSG